MDELLLKNINDLFKNKNNEIQEILNLKNKKMTSINKSLDLDYASKKTISKINTEEKRKYESSKAYKKKMQDNI